VVSLLYMNEPSVRIRGVTPGAAMTSSGGRIRGSATNVTTANVSPVPAAKSLLGDSPA
jgi:hypothetical protein